MNINIDEIEVIRRLLETLDGEVVRKAEAVTSKNKVNVYCIKDNQVRVDIVARKIS